MGCELDLGEAKRYCLGTMYILAALLLIVPEVAFAYIGPGAGFAFLGSTFVFVLTIFMALATIALWPLQWVFRKARGFGVSKKAKARRVVIVGLDGLEPSLVEKYMQAGTMPNLKALREEGSYERLGTTLPALSPVAWSTFQTGVNPGAHNIFDFLTRDKRSCLPLLSSTETERSGKFFKLFGLKIPLRAPKVVITRKSRPFWKILGDYGIYSNVLRVPISYPPEKFRGNILSAMCTPDLKGTQGSFSFFTTRKKQGQTTGGEMRELIREGKTFRGEIDGPPAPKGEGYLKAQFSVEVLDATQEAILTVGKSKTILTLNTFSSWIELEFRYGRKLVSGIARFCVRELGEEFSLYVSPVNANPDKPALPIAQPIFFSSWLAKRQGSFGTLGLLEDTWGRNELALDDQRFLDQAYLTHEERERMFMDLLDRTREGVCVCVFDASDRIQHMFWRYLDSQHPSPVEDRAKFADVIPEMYQRMDQLVGKVRASIRPDDLLIVLSDHGFASFRRGLNINTWLFQNGYLALKDGKTVGADYLQDVDWSKTRAFAIGLSGLYLNVKGRERFGIVDPENVDALKREIIAKLESVTDPKEQTRAVRKVYDTAQEYRGLYTDEAPDLIVGYAPGYRVSWDSVTGTIEPELFSDNIKAWSGDHHVDPKVIPGIIFSNRKIKKPDPHIVDIAPTVLDTFAAKIPAYMEGQVIF